jgi:hypothetical protein
LEIALEKGIESIMMYEIDEAVLPTALLPVIIEQAIQTSLLLSPEKEFYFTVGEISNTENNLSDTNLFLETNKNSTMTIVEALPIISFVMSNLIKSARKQIADNPWIESLAFNEYNLISETQNSNVAS